MEPQQRQNILANRSPNWSHLVCAFNKALQRRSGQSAPKMEPHWLQGVIPKRSRNGANCRCGVFNKALPKWSHVSYEIAWQTGRNVWFESVNVALNIADPASRKAQSTFAAAAGRRPPGPSAADDDARCHSHDASISGPLFATEPSTSEAAKARREA